jgi:hypothetical protein
MALADTVQIASILLLESDKSLSPQQARATSCASYTVDEFAQAMADAAKLESLQGRLHAIGERQCNGYSTFGHKWDQAAADRDERLEEKLNKTVESILAPYGVKAKTGGDPRGSAIKLQTPKTGRHNTWGGAESGWAI